jgi:hypothetical protein
MKLTVLMPCATAAALALSLSACATADQKAFYKDIEGCQREYTGSVSAGVLQGGGFTGSVHIQCDPLLMTKANAAKVKAEAPAKPADPVTP